MSEVEIVMATQYVLNLQPTWGAIELFLNSLTPEIKGQVVNHFLQTKKLRSLFPELASIFDVHFGVN